MKILVVCQDYYPETFCITAICEELVNRGNQVTVLTGIPNYGQHAYYPGYTKKPKDEIINGVSVLRVRVTARKKGSFSLIWNYLSFWYFSKQRARKLEEHFDAVYSMCLSPLTAVCAANIVAKKQKIIHIHHCLDVWPESMVETGYLKRKGLLYSIIFRKCKKIYSKADKILISSPSFRSFFENDMGFSNKRIIYVPQPYYRTEENLQPIIFSSSLNIVYAGNVGKAQNLVPLIRALAAVKERKDVFFHILGDGSDLENVKQQVTKSGLSNRVIFHGSVPASKVGNWFVNADALVVSLRNGTTIVSSTIPNKLINYMKYGKPIIGVIGGDGAKILQVTQPGFIDEYSLATFPEQLKKIAEGWQANGNQTYCEAHFSLNIIVDQIEESLKQNQF